ncbi:sensor histidine kinase [Streptomyces scopuliridis]|uniref:sensor histidine kinase n=1 Tax=Streptomyces scopuliridis TaxID=452529 RepID=UPI00068B1CD9|nr:sensor histidine kinase [Streptomyces scopuliridis]
MALDDGSQPRPHFLPPALRAPFEGRTWREFGYLLLSLPISAVLFGYAMATIALGAGLLVTFLGVPVLAVGLAGCRGFGMLERARARGLLGLDVPDPAPARGAKSGLMSWVGAVLKSGVSWRHLLYAILHFPWAVFAFVVSLSFSAVGWALFSYPLWHWVFPSHLDQSGIAIYSDGTGDGFFLDTPFEIAATAVVGLVLVLFCPWLIRGLATVDRLLVMGLLGPSRLATRVSELESDRGVVVDTAAADLRRIERDLHDVRDLARGIHPAVLTDRGLDAALSAIASRCTVPVTVEVDLPCRPAAAIEGIAYFTVSELLQNVSKHARASRAMVEVWQTQDRLLLQVTDDGRGGADATAGSGLAGLAERLDAVDGILVIDSPAGGPTTVTAELPWRG